MDANTLCDRHDGTLVYYDPDAHPAGCPWCAMIDAHHEELREAEDAACAQVWEAGQRAERAQQEAQRVRHEAESEHWQRNAEVRRMKKDAEDREWRRRLGIPF